LKRWNETKKGNKEGLGTMALFSGIADEAGSTIEQQLEVHQELGWEYIELRMIEGENITRLNDEKFEQIVSKLLKTGIKVSCFASKIGDWSRRIGNPFEEDVRDLQVAIPRMQRLGTQYIRVMSWPNDGWEEADWEREALRRMGELVRIAEKAKIILAHENCSGWGGRPQTCRELVETINSPCLKVLYDTGNPAVEGYDSWQFYQAVKNYIAYLHIKDALNKDSSGKEKYTFPGEGDGKVKEVLGNLLFSGYDGFISIEPHLALVIHDQTKADKGKDPHQVYLEYGQRLMKLVIGIESDKV